MSKMLHDSDISIVPLRGKTIAVIGYGNQGRAHALNLRDSGLAVVVGQRQGGRGYAQAQSDSFEPLPINQATARADLIILALPDESAPAAYHDFIAPNIRAGQALGFIHGFNVHYGRIVAPDGVDVVMVAPKGAGYKVRAAYEQGAGLPCMVAIARDGSGSAKDLALAWAGGIGGGRAGVMLTTFRDETETDLFGEQASVVGGVLALMTTSFETLVEAGYDPQQAYFECVHEVKYVVDLIHAGGMGEMLDRISRTAAYGGLSSADRLSAALRPAMRVLLQDVREGRFAKQWIAEAESGLQQFVRLVQAARRHPAEQAGQDLGLLQSPGGDR